MKGSSLIMALACLMAPPEAEAAPKAQSLAAELARLRGEVDEVSQRIESVKTLEATRARSLASRRAELELQLSRERLRLEHLRKRQRQLQKRRAKESESKARLLPLLKEVAALVSGALESGLPFRRADRRRAITSLVEQAEAKRLPADEAISRLWSQLEDELRLGSESGLYTQVIELDGKKQLAEVARVGMVMLFFRTRDGRVGQALRRGAEWRYEPIDSAKQAAQVRRLFDAFKKQIRTGYFELPAALRIKGEAP